LGAYKLPGKLRAAGLNVIVHDDIYRQTERDPWIFYDCGMQGRIVITSDKAFMKSFPHMAAIRLGATTVLAFSTNSYHSDVRASAFIRVKDAIFRELHRQKGSPFIASIGMSGEFRMLEKSPMPQRKFCDDKDWISYERVCTEAGVLAIRPEEPKGPNAKPAVV